MDKKVWLGKTLSVLELVLGFAPAAVLIGQYMTPRCVLLPMLLALLLWLSGSLMALLKAGRRLSAALLTAALMLGMTLALGAKDDLLMLTVLLPYLIPLFLMPPGLAHPVWDEWPALLHALMMGIHLLVQIIVHFKPEFSDISGLLFALIAVYTLLMLVSMNRRNLRGGMLDGQKAPPKVLYRNRTLLIVLYLLGLVCAAWQTLGTWLDTAWEALKSAIWAVIKWVMSLGPKGGSAAGGAGGGGMEGLAELGGPTEQSWLSKLLEKIVMYFAYALAAAIIGYALYFLGKKLVRLVKYIISRLKAYAEVSAEEYVDETESTLNLEDRAEQLRERVHSLFSRKKEQPYEALDGAMRVRRLYRQYIRRQDISGSMTAQEALAKEKKAPAGFAGLYDRARYGDEQIPSGEADAIREQMKGSRMI